MPLDATSEARCAAAFMRQALTEPCSWTKPNLAAAITAVDQWVDDNATAYNTALPQPFRGAATATQKADLLCYVILRRQGRLPVPEDG